MIDVLLATCRPDAAMLETQIASIRAQRNVEVNLIIREDSGMEGACANFSHLLSQSSSPYVAFADQDDVWFPGKLSSLMNCLHELEVRHGSDVPLLVFCDSRVTDAELQPLPGTFLSRQGVNVRRGLSLSRLLMQNFIAGNLMLFNAALREKAGVVPSGALMHDCWVALVAAAFGKIGFVDEALLDYRQHGENTLGATDAGMRHFLCRARQGVKAFRKRLSANVGQAQSFLERFGSETPACARALAHLPETGYVRRRLALMRHGLFKQGLIRNIALFLMA